MYFITISSTERTAEPHALPVRLSFGPVGFRQRGGKNVCHVLDFLERSLYVVPAKAGDLYTVPSRSTAEYGSRLCGRDDTNVCMR